MLPQPMVTIRRIQASEVEKLGEITVAAYEALDGMDLGSYADVLRNVYEQVKRRGLPASGLLQKAVRAEIRRQDLLAETDRYLTELVDEVGEPSPQELSRAETVVHRIQRTRASRAS